MSVRILVGDVREKLKDLDDESVQCVVTSPPYWGLRDYGVAGQLGLEKTPEEHVDAMVEVFREVRRVLRADGVCFINYGDSYFSADAIRRDARDNDTDGKESRGSQGRDSACLDLCDECSAVLSNRIARTSPSDSGSSQLAENGDRHKDVSGSRLEATDVSPHGVPVSTKPGSSRQSPALCSHCPNCGACLSVLRSSSRDARLCVRNVLYKRDIFQRGSASRNQDKDASGSAWGYSAMADLKSKDLVGMPWKIAFALQADGWYLRSDIIWAKNNPMPESVTDRPTKSHEHIFLMTKSSRYYYDADAVREKFDGPLHTPGNLNKVPGRKRNDLGFPERMDAVWGNPKGRNLRDVWTIPTHAYSAAHFATFPPKLVDPCIKAGSSEEGCCSVCLSPRERVVEKGDLIPTGKKHDKRAYGVVVDRPDKSDQGRNRARDGHRANMAFENKTTGWKPTCDHDAAAIPCTILDPFGGAGTVGLVADRLGRDAVLIELNPEYAAMAKRRIYDDCPLFSKVE